MIGERGLELVELRELWMVGFVTKSIEGEFTLILTRFDRYSLILEDFSIDADEPVALPSGVRM
jgi:hypothetical protein